MVGIGVHRKKCPPAATKWRLLELVLLLLRLPRRVTNWDGISGMFARHIKKVLVKLMNLIYGYTHFQVSVR